MFSLGDIKKRQAPCPTCGRVQFVTTKFQEKIPWELNDNENFAQGANEYYVLECNGCKSIVFCTSSASTEDIDYRYLENGEEEAFYPFTKQFWPEIPKKHVEKIPLIDLFFKHQDLCKILSETYRAVESNLPTLAAIGLRTSFDLASAILNIDHTLGFDKKLEELRKSGFISGKDKGALKSLVEAGNAAAHRGWSPSKDDLEIIIDILNSFIDRNIVSPEKHKHLKKQIPAKNSG